MTRLRRTAVLTIAFWTSAVAAWAQTTLTVEPGVVAPGGTVSLRVGGTAGQRFAVVGSTVNSGFSYAGVALAVGNDVVILATGVLDGSGVATVGVIPPFTGTTLDRYYLQAVTSQSPAFIPLVASAGVVIRNRDASAPSVTGTSVAGVASTLNGCNQVVLASTPVTVTSPTKIFATGRGSYARNGTNLASGVMQVYLRNGAGTVMAVSSSAIGTTATALERSPISLSEFLKVYSAMSGPTSQDFVATPGTYALQLVAGASDGVCSGSPAVWYPVLTYLLVGAQ